MECMSRKSALKLVAGIALTTAFLLVLATSVFEVIRPVDPKGLRKEARKERNTPETIGEGSRVQGAALAKGILAFFGALAATPLWQKSARRRGVAPRLKTLLVVAGGLLGVGLLFVLDPLIGYLIGSLIE